MAIIPIADRELASALSPSQRRLVDRLSHGMPVKVTELIRSVYPDATDLDRYFGRFRVLVSTTNDALRKIHDRREIYTPRRGFRAMLL